MSGRFYYIYKKCDIDGGYFFIFKMKVSNPNEVRWYLAENNFEGRFMWNSGARARKNYYTSLYK